MEKKNRVEYEGILHLGNFEINCYVLSDGRRILSGREMQRALNMVDDVAEGKQNPGTRLTRYLGQKSLIPFIFKDKGLDHFEPIICYKGGSKINGYEATILVDICDGFLEARKHIELSHRQEMIANQCEVLMRSFAKVGLIALIDEATGYQYEREHDELQKILKAYISPELLPWQMRFPPDFYIQLFRLNGWDYTVNGIKKRPGVIGTWTKRLVYEQLPPGVLHALEENTPKSPAGNYKAKLHQSLTDDIGNPHLAAQITQVVTLFKLSDNMAHMWSQFRRLKKVDDSKVKTSDFIKVTEKEPVQKKRESTQLTLPFDFDENGHTIEPIDESTLSDFNKNLKKALDFNPKS